MKALWALLIALLIALIILILGVLLGWWSNSSGSGSTSTAQPTSSATGSIAPTMPGAGTQFVSRPVTTGAQIPSANALTEAVLGQAGAGWVLAISDSTSWTDGGLITDGVKVLYLIKPDGTRYEVANLTTAGYASPDLVAWHHGRDAVLLSEGGSDLMVLSLMSGAVEESWTACSGNGSFRGAALPDGNWLVRGSCDSDPIDGRYADDGTALPAGGIKSGPWGTVYFDVGRVQVSHSFEGLASEQFLAYQPDGSSSQLSLPASTTDCYPLGKGRGDTLAVYCYGATDVPDVYELPIDGSAAVPVASGVNIDDMWDREVPGGPYFPPLVTGYCGVGAHPVIESRDERDVLGVMGLAELDILNVSPYTAEECHGGVGPIVLASGPGPLWTINLNTFDVVWMLPGGRDDYPLYVIGADDTNSLIHP